MPKKRFALGKQSGGFPDAFKKAALDAGIAGVQRLDVKLRPHTELVVDEWVQGERRKSELKSRNKFDLDWPLIERAPFDWPQINSSITNRPLHN